MRTIQHLNPETLFKLDSMSQIVVVGAGRTAYIAGQGAFNETFELMGENDLAAQTLQAYRNILHCLDNLGVAPERVVSSTVYVVGLNEVKTQQYVEIMNRSWSGKPFPPHASTLVGVTALGIPGMLIEISAVVALDD